MVVMHISNIPREIILTYALGGSLVLAWKGGRAGQVMGALHAAITVNGYAHLYPLFFGLPENLAELSVALALTAAGRSYWMIWASAAFLLSAVADLVILARPDLGLWGYWSTELALFYASTTALILAALAGGLRRPELAGLAPS